MGRKRDIKTYYELLLSAYGTQGWWPKIENGQCVYSLEFTLQEKVEHRLEIAVGAVLTQNTNWGNASKALLAVAEDGPISLEKLEHPHLAERIRIAGFHQQKAKKLGYLARVWREWGERTPAREELLGVWGIGPETADDILLYGFGVKVFVADRYAIRLFTRLGWGELNYESLRVLVEDALDELYELREFHALIVEHAKRHCASVPRCYECPLQEQCLYIRK